MTRSGVLGLLAFAAIGAWLWSRSAETPQEFAETPETTTTDMSPDAPPDGGPVQADEFVFTSVGGAEIRGRVHRGDSPHAPLVLLIHGMRGGMERWSEALTRWTRSPDLTWVQVDFPRPLPEATPTLSTGDGPWREHIAHVRGALATIRARADLTPSAIGILAEDIGGSLALLLASEDPGIQSLAWLDPGLQYRKLNVREAASSIRDRPLLYMTTTGDRYSRHSAQALARRSERGEARLLEGSSSHGASAMGAHPDIAESIRAWLADTLSAAPARR